jgi:hypothetical protein
MRCFLESGLQNQVGHVTRSVRRNQLRKRPTTGRATTELCSPGVQRHRFSAALIARGPANHLLIVWRKKRSSSRGLEPWFASCATRKRLVEQWRRRRLNINRETAPRGRTNRG